MQEVPAETCARVGLGPRRDADPPLAGDDPEAIIAAIAALAPGPGLAATLEPLLAALEGALGGVFTLQRRPPLVLPPARSLRWSPALDLLIVRGDDAFVAVDLAERRVVLHGRAVATMTIADTFDARTGPIHTWQFSWMVSGPGLQGQAPGAGAPPPALLRALMARRRRLGLPEDDDARASVAAALALETRPQTISRRADGRSSRPPPALADRGPEPDATPPAGLAVELPAHVGARRAELRASAVVLVGLGGEATPLGEGPPPGVQALALTSDAAVAAHALTDGHLHLWRSDPLRGLAIDLGEVAHALAFTPDGALLAWIGGATLGLLRVADGALLWRREDPRGWTALAAGAAGVIAASVGGQVVAWDLDGRLRGTTRIPEVAELALLAGGDAAILGFDARVCRWTPGEDLPGSLVEGAGEGYHRLAASPDGRALALAVWDAALRIDPASGRVIERVPIDVGIESIAIDGEGDLFIGLGGGAGWQRSLLWRPADRRPPTRVPLASERPIVAAAAGLFGELHGGGSRIRDVASGSVLVRRDDIAGVGGIERHGGAIDGWGEWAAAMVAHVGAVALPTAPLLAAAATPGLWRRRLAALRPG